MALFVFCKLDKILRNTCSVLTNGKFASNLASTMQVNKTSDIFTTNKIQIFQVSNRVSILVNVFSVETRGLSAVSLHIDREEHDNVQLIPS